MGRALVLTDSPPLYARFLALVERLGIPRARFDFGHSPSCAGFAAHGEVRALDVRAVAGDIAARYELVLSLHCKQIFPKRLVRAVRCVNVHPGLNPHNRGWYPQVFAILNKRPHGATLHEMDEQVDHGPIIAQEEVAVRSWDTSQTVYERVLDAEFRLLEEHLPRILAGDYLARPPADEGNVNRIADFERLRQLDPGERASYGEVIDRLRALTHPPYKNAFFVDEQGHKVHVSLHLEKLEE